MRRFVIFLAAAAAASNLFAVAPQFWRIRSAEDFLGGEIDGFAVTSRGQLRPGPTAHKIATFTDPFVLAQVTAPNGDHFFGTGNEGKVYRLRGTEMKAIYTAPEPEIYAVAYRDGTLYVGSSPNGKIYRVDPESGKATPFYDPKQAYIWAMQFVGNDLAVATGVDGKLFRVSPSGEGKVWFDSSETHLRSIAVRPSGSVLVGGSGKGRIYSVAPDGSAHALYDSALNEISSIYVDPNGTGWAAAVSNVLPVAAPAKPQQQQQQQQQQQKQQQTTSSQGEAKKDEANPSVEVSFSFDEASGGGSSAQPGAGELYRINSDDFVETVRKFDREMIYAISGGPNGSILLSTGPQGRIYQFKDGEISLVANVSEKQVVSIDSNGGATLITTTNSGAVYRLDNAASNKAEFRSTAKDVERFSRFGHYRIDGNHVDGGTLAIAFRTGNTRTPDTTWSPWTIASPLPEGSINTPPGRYIQWKLSMPKPAPEISVETVTIAFMNRNVAPVIDSVTVQDPAVVFITSAYPSSPSVVEATNPDEYGIFTSLDNPREKTADPGKKVFRKGYRTIVWRGHDDNNDSLRYSVAFRQKGSERWLRLRDNIDENAVNFDTSQLPDGTYELRLVASDALENPELPLSDTKEGVEFTVDNTAPDVKVTARGNDVLIHVTDRMSPVGRVEYSADAQKWIRLIPVDGIADSPDETYKLSRSEVDGKFVIIRATDAFYNVTTESVNLK
ncbi:MAG TPA: PQQ-binding-like beta-propeller repeat protein [Thermoanaerobaculia bacterium]|nr:PQQ-binding-like beta-propeller repeat protein [Thermoanaerobaculia bacterium]